MKTVIEKPSPFICPDCGSTTEPVRHPFRSGLWIDQSKNSCSACEERRLSAEEKAERLKVIDRMAAGIDYVLLGRGLTPKLLRAQIEQVPEKLRHLLDSPDGAYIYGPPGTGKSFLFAALLRQAAVDAFTRARETASLPEFNQLPFFANVNELLWRLRLASIGQGEAGETEAYVMGLFIHYPVLLLDDIGVRRPTEFVEDALYEITNAREQYLRSTFFTSNYSLRELAARIEPRTVSRIVGLTTGRVVFLGGADRRLTARERL